MSHQTKQNKQKTLASSLQAVFGTTACAYTTTKALCFC